MEDIHNVCLVGPSNSSGTASGRLLVAQGDGPAVFWPPCWHCLTWTCAAGVRESRVNQLKPFGQRDVKTPDLTKEGGTQAEMLPELLLQESERGGGSGITSQGEKGLLFQVLLVGGSAL